MSDDTLVLCYHALSERFPAQLSTTPELFARQLRRLRSRGYRGVTFSQAAQKPRGRTVAITFDDGYRSVLQLGLPILQELGWPATIFVPTDFVGSEEPMSWPGIDRWLGGEHESELLPLAWSELAHLASLGWEVGSHTCSHPRLSELDDERLAYELGESKAVCELHLGGSCRSLAYPYGDVNQRVVAAARAAAYSSAAALRPCPRLPLDWPRVGVYFKDDLTRFSVKCLPLVRRLRGERTSASG